VGRGGRGRGAGRARTWGGAGADVGRGERGRGAGRARTWGWVGWITVGCVFVAVEWSGLSPELLLTLERGPRGGAATGQARVPLRAQLEARLRDAIRSGRLRAGERLPSSRELARALGTSRGLVQECYAQLQAEGYLTSRVGAATVVADTAPPDTRGPAPARPATPGPPRRLLADFRSGVPDLASFPRGDWSWALREAVRTAPNDAFDYGDPRGSAALREVLAAYLRRVRAAAADPANTVICTGCAQGLGLTLRVLARAGIDRVAVEDPGYADAATATAWAGVTAVPVPVDDDGVDVGALRASGARAVILTPAHQWPTGVVLSAERRHALVAWAAERDGVIIEDDYDAEFRYDRDPVGSLQGLAPDRVVAMGTVSKSLAPSMRIGWLVCPPALAGEIAEEKRLSDRGSPEPSQLALAMLIESGRYDRHLRRMRGVYATRRAALVAALSAHAPAVKLTGLAAGFHAVAHLPDGVAEGAVIAAALDRSVGLYGMSAQRYSGAAEPPALVLGFGNLGERAITAGVAAVSDLLTG
jgi:GntR family transcriptional regulator/MocR family aminotransferase